jgi:GDP-L-fucose synthase
VYKDASIYVAGGRTLIGAAILKELENRGHRNVFGGAGEEPDLTDALEVEKFFTWTSPEYVFVAAGSSGGIRANQKYPADLMLDNLLVECHVIREAFRQGVVKLLYLGSSCCYPRSCPQPIREEYLLTGLLEPTNEPYAVAKIAGIRLCQAYRQQYGANFICGIPANAFGPGDDFSEEDSHVIAALIRRMHRAKEENAPSVEIWGTGSPRREFIYAPDLGDACVAVMEEYNDGAPINLASGTDVSILELATLIKEVIGFYGEIRCDPGKPDGMPWKILDGTKLKELNWEPRTPFRSALEQTYASFLASNEVGPCYQVQLMAMEETC